MTKCLAITKSHKSQCKRKNILNNYCTYHTNKKYKLLKNQLLLTDKKFNFSKINEISGDPIQLFTPSKINPPIIINSEPNLPIITDSEIIKPTINLQKSDYSIIKNSINIKRYIFTNFGLKLIYSGDISKINTNITLFFQENETIFPYNIPDQLLSETILSNNITYKDNIFHSIQSDHFFN
jgi:hypothetical protein